MRKIKERIESAIIKFKFMIKDDIQNEDGIGVVEIILILLVLVGIVVIFKSQITSIAKSIFGNITKTVNSL